MLKALRTFTECQKICILIAHAYLLGVMFKDLLQKQHFRPLTQNQEFSRNTMEHFVNLYSSRAQIINNGPRQKYKKSFGVYSATF